MAARPDGAPVRLRRRRRRHPDHDLLRPDATSTRSSRRMHEYGHGLYEHQVDRGARAHAARLGRLARPARVAEPHVGEPRRPQPAVLARLLRARAGALPRSSSGRSTLERWYAAVNRVHPSLIRIHADEVTYNMHVILRFELEQEIIDGRIDLRDLPEAWNATMDEYLGIEVPSDARGRAPGRALVGRRDRLLPDLLARQRDVAPDLGARAARSLPDLYDAHRARRVRRPARVAAATSCTGTGASSRRRRRSRARRRPDRRRAVPALPAREAPAGAPA